jgi:glutamate synthase (NADPH/NADH) small chain
MAKTAHMPERPANERNKDFGEVNLGLSTEAAFAEAKRCLQCKKPACVPGCPVEINIPGFIGAIARGDNNEALAVLKQKNNLPAVCGRVCPQENQCEKACILNNKNVPIAIGWLERYASDHGVESNIKSQISDIRNNQTRIAVVGSGPAGLTAAGDLAKMGYAVTVYESLHAAGGVLRYGIPEFRLPGRVLDGELKSLERLGVKILPNYLIGRTKTVPELFGEGYKAIFVGTGAGLPKFLGIPGENLNNVYSANEFLVRVNLMKAWQFPATDTPVYTGSKVAVVGGGNTAMDAARTAMRLGAAEVHLVYRRSREEMPARVEEIEHAIQEGVKLDALTSPLRLIGDEKGFVTGMECLKMELGEPDKTGRRSPVEIPNSNFVLDINMTIIAIGLSPNPVLPSLTKGLETLPDGHLKIDDKFMTSIPGVFAGGDIVGGDTVIRAMGMGKKAARSIDEYLKAHS